MVLQLDPWDPATSLLGPQTKQDLHVRKELDEQKPDEQRVAGPFSGSAKVSISPGLQVCKEYILWSQNYIHPNYAGAVRRPSVWHLQQRPMKALMWIQVLYVQKENIDRSSDSGILAVLSGAFGRFWDLHRARD